MDKESFGKSMSLLSDAYCRKDLLEKSVLNTWYRYLGDTDADIFAEVVDRYIKENSHAPAISDLYASCTTKMHFRKDKENV